MQKARLLKNFVLKVGLFCCLLNRFFSQLDVIPNPRSQADVIPNPRSQVDVIPNPRSQVDVIPNPRSQVDVIPNPRRGEESCTSERKIPLRFAHRNDTYLFKALLCHSLHGAKTQPFQLLPIRRQGDGGDDFVIGDPLI